MDKRSLLFAFALSATFLLVQTWFTPKNEHTTSQTLQSQRVDERTKRTLKIEDLPVVQFYADASLTKAIGSGVVCNELMITLSPSQTLPQKLYINKDGKAVALYSQLEKEQSQDPLIYAAHQLTTLKVPSIPMDTPTDLQLVTANSEARVVLAEQQGESLNIPFHYLDEPAIALLQTENQYLPVGIFDPETKKVKALHDFQKLHTIVQQDQAQLAQSLNANEEFYVLENDFQQIVFSTKGGAIAEINLPFKSADNQLSIVKEIDFDREILHSSPKNATFPLFPYTAFSNGGPQKYHTGSLGGYYPLLRRPIIGSDGIQKTPFPAQFYAFNVVGDDPKIAQMHYKVTRFEPNLIQFEAKSSQRRILKTFSIPKERNGPYCLQMDIQIEGDAQDLWITSGVPDVEILGGSYSPLLRIQTTKGRSSDVDTLSLPKKETIQKMGTEPSWLSNSNGFFGIIQDPLTKLNPGLKTAQIAGNELPTRLSLIDAAYDLYPPQNYPGYMTYLPLKGGNTLSFRIFAGPYDEALLKQLDGLYEDPLTHYNPEYTAAQSIQGWFSFISEPFAKFLFLLMELFYAVSGSWALSIVLVTIALRAMMYPLNAWQIRSSMKTQQAAPKIKAIQEKYKNDPKRMHMEVMNMYRKEGGNPLIGCLPALLQMPLIIGMLYLLKSAFPLRGAPFIPGWIDNLAAPDILFSWGMPIWFIGNELHLLPILMAGSMYLQQKINSPLPKDATALSDTQKQQKMMGAILPLVLLFAFYNLPSGLNIYFMLSTLLGIAQQWWMAKKTKEANKISTNYTHSNK